MPEIKTQEELKDFVETTVDTKVKEFDDAVKEIIDLKKEKEIMQGKLADFQAKIESLVLANKARGDWKEGDTQIGKDYRLGRILQLMIQARNCGRGMESFPISTPHKELKDMGCGFAREKPLDGWTGMEEKTIAVPGQKAGVSSTPQTGDDSGGSYGGSYTVPVEYARELNRIARDNSVMMSKVRRIPVTGITTYLMKTTDELAWTKVTNQSTAKTEDTLTFSQLTLTTCIYAAYIAITEEFLEDTMIATGELLRTMWGEAWGKKFDNLCLIDTTYGILADSSINSYVIGGSSFSDVTVQEAKDGVKLLTTQALRAGGEFFTHITNWDILEDETDDNGNYKLRAPADKAVPRMHGYPVNFPDAMTDNSSSAASTAFMGFGNPKYILNGDRVGYEFKIYDQTQSGMEYGQVYFRVRTRQAFLAVHPEAWVVYKTAA